MIEYTNSRVTEVIDEYIHSERDRNILKDRYINGLTYEKISERHNLSVKQIRNILCKNEQVLIKHL